MDESTTATSGSHGAAEVHVALSLTHEVTPVCEPWFDVDARPTAIVEELRHRVGARGSAAPHIDVEARVLVGERS